MEIARAHLSSDMCQSVCAQSLCWPYIAHTSNDPKTLASVHSSCLESTNVLSLQGHLLVEHALVADVVPQGLRRKLGAAFGPLLDRW